MRSWSARRAYLARHLAVFSHKILKSGSVSYDFLLGARLRRDLSGSRLGFDAAAVQATPVNYDKELGAEALIESGGDVDDLYLYSKYFYQT